MHVTSVSREEVDTLLQAFNFYDDDRDGRINVFQFYVILKWVFVNLNLNTCRSMTDCASSDSAASKNWNIEN